MDKNIFEVITENAVNERLIDVLLQDDDYQQSQNKIDSLTNELDKFNLPKEQRVVIDRLVSSYNESGALYGKVTYQAGFRDCASLLLDIGMIKDGKGEGAE